MAYLNLPSITDDSLEIVIEDINLEEALAYVKLFDARAASHFKLKLNPAPIDASVVEYKLVEDLYQEDWYGVVQQLKLSDLRGFRGKRAVIVDEDNDAIYVGTTVIYNRNWATLGVQDDTIADTIFNEIG